jgi:hypothetical protein
MAAKGSGWHLIALREFLSVYKPMSLRQIPTQDERWLAFVAQTRDVFEVFPQLIPLRMTIFRSFIQAKSDFSWESILKYQVRRWLLSRRSTGDFTPKDVVFWLDSSREVLVEAIMPVRNALLSQGVGSALIVTSNVYKTLQSTAPTINFSFPRQWGNVAHWLDGWKALREVLGDDLPESYRSAFLFEGRLSDSIAYETERVLNRLRPQLVVVAVEEYPPAATLCVTAHHLGIKTLVLLHGTVQPLNAPLTAERMAVWGSFSHDQMIAFGVPADQLVVLGSPRHDRFPAQSAAEARRKLQSSLGLRDLPYFVFFSNLHDITRHTAQVVNSCVQWLAEASAQFGNQIEFIIRLHPNEDGAAYRNYPALRLFKKECDLDTTLAGADICAAVSSTTMQEALLYQKPVLQFYGDGWPEFSSNWKQGLAYRIKDEAQLIEVLSTIQDGCPVLGHIVEQQQSHLSEIFAHHGTAGHRVGQYILEQIKATHGKNNTSNLISI